MSSLQPSKIQAQALPIILDKKYSPLQDGIIYSMQHVMINYTRVHSAICPDYCRRPNLWGQAHHGSGKTAAYSLSLLSAVDEKKQFPQARLSTIAPNRVRCNQI